jgi:hypothetical protein
MFVRLFFIYNIVHQFGSSFVLWLLAIGDICNISFEIFWSISRLLVNMLWITFIVSSFDIVASLPHTGSVEMQKPRNTHATIEEGVFAARCWVMHATMGSLLSVLYSLLCYNSFSLCLPAYEPNSQLLCTTHFFFRSWYLLISSLLYSSSGIFFQRNRAH